MKYSIVAVFAMFATTSCNHGGADNHADDTHAEDTGHSTELVLTAEQIKAVDIRLGKVEMKELNSVVRANGTLMLAPQNRAEVTSLIGGVVRSIAVREGQTVNKGQTVAFVENTEIVELQKNYLTAQKRMLLSEQEYARQQTLNAGGAGVEKNLQQAKAAAEIARAEAVGLRQQLRQLSLDPVAVERGEISRSVAVKAPIRGIVTQINISTGSYADTQTALMLIADNSAVFCSLNVFESDVNRIHEGQSVDILLSGAGNARLTGKVSAINRCLDAESKTIPVHVAIVDRGEAQLIPGMYANATVNTGKQKSEALPDEAIVSLEGRNYIFMLKERSGIGDSATYAFEKREIVTGTTELGYTQVTFVHSLPTDATVVTKNAFYIASMSEDHGEH